MSNDLIKIDEELLERQRAETAVENQTITDQVTEVVITSAEQADQVTMLLGVATTRLKDLEAKRKFAKEPFLDGGKRIDSVFNDLKAPVEEAVEILKTAVKDWRKKEADRIAEQTRQIEAQQKAEREKQEAAQKKEQEEAAAAQAKAEAEAAAAAERAAGGDHDAEAAAEQARKAAEQAQMAARIAAEKKPVVLTQVKEVQTSSISAGGTNVNARKVWKFEVIDPDKVPTAYKTVDEKKIRQAVKEEVRDIPGVRIYEDEQIAVRAA